MRSGDEIEASVSDLDGDASGTATVDGFDLRIPGTAPGDRVRARVLHVSPHRPTAWCAPVEILARGSQYCLPPCPDASARGGRCGGCPAMHLTQGAAAQFKTEKVRRALTAVGLSSPLSFVPVATSLGYRNRGYFGAARDASGRLFLGGFAPRTREIIPLKACMVLSLPIQQAVRKLTDLLSGADYAVHPEPFGVRYVTLRSSTEGSVVAELVLNDRPLPALASIAAHAIEAPPIVGVSYSINSTAGNSLRTGPSVLLTGRNTVEERLGEVTLALGAGSFSQLNSSVAAAMYDRAASLCSAVSTIWDLYCGVGGLGLTALVRASTAASLFGVEVVEASIDSARRNAESMGLSPRATFVSADLAGGIPSPPFAPELVLVNPPRKGLDPAVIEGVVCSEARTIVYMSCNPETFARDASALSAFGFRLIEVFIYDMLPGTAHVEILGRLHR